MLDQMLNVANMLVSENALLHIACNLLLSSENNHAQDGALQLLQELHVLSLPKEKQALVLYHSNSRDALVSLNDGSTLQPLSLAIHATFEEQKHK